MKWEQIRDKFPNSWVLFEAIGAYSDNGKRIIEEVELLETFNSGNEAMKKYIEIHKEKPDKEFLIYNTKNEKIEIKENLWMGVRKL